MITENEIQALVNLGRGQISESIIRAKSVNHKIENNKIRYEVTGLISNNKKISHSITIKHDISEGIII